MHSLNFCTLNRSGFLLSRLEGHFSVLPCEKACRLLSFFNQFWIFGRPSSVARIYFKNFISIVYFPIPLNGNVSLSTFLIISFCIIKGYVSVLSRPMAERNVHDPIWSSVYVDSGPLGMMITGTLPAFVRTNTTVSKPYIHSHLYFNRFHAEFRFYFSSCVVLCCVVLCCV